MKTNYLKLTCVVFASFFMNVLYAQNLIAYYPFSGNAADSSGNGHNGTDSNVVLVADRYGMPGKAYSFDGNAIISIPANTMQYNNYTYSLWAKIGVLPANGTGYAMLSIGNSSALGDQNMILGNQYSTPVLTGFGGGSYTNPSIYPLPPSTVKTGTLPLVNQWYHIVMVRDTVRRKLIFFVDGIKIGEDTLRVAKAGYASPCIGKIGSRSPGNFQFFKGAIDDVRIYDYAFTDVNVVALYNSEKTTTGITDIEGTLSHSLNIYPNPSDGAIKIIANNFSGKMTICNANGLTVVTNHVFTGMAEITDLEAGIYFCVIENQAGNQEVTKFIITQ
ncbi:MAG: LamG-like jellyroll fold domain-containing protein [Bacteroidota bacterium]